METGRPRKHRSLIEEYLKKLETQEEPVKVVDKTVVHAPVDVDKKKQDPAPVATAPVQGKQEK